MSQFGGNDEEVPRVAPTRKDIKFQIPTPPLVPEASMVIMSKDASQYQWRRPTPIVAESMPMSSETKHTQIHVQSTYRKTTESNLKYVQYLHLNKLPMPRIPLPRALGSYQSPVSPNYPTVSFPPPQAPVLSNENEIIDLKKLIEKLTIEIAKLKVTEKVEHEKTRELLMKPKINTKSIGIQCKLDHDFNLDYKNQQNPDKTKSETGAIPKTRPIKQISGDKATEMTLKMHAPKPETDQDRFEILSELSRAKLEEAMEIMALTAKYIPKGKLNEWGFYDQKAGRADVSIASRRYMEKYGLIGSMPMEKDEEGPKDPEKIQTIQESSDKFLDTKTIKKQPKFM